MLPLTLTYLDMLPLLDTVELRGGGVVVVCVSVHSFLNPKFGNFVFSMLSREGSGLAFLPTWDLESKNE